MSGKAVVLEVVSGSDDAEGGTITFSVGAHGETEVLRFEGNGDAYVRGSLVANDLEVYEAFVAWLKAQGELI